MSHPKIKAAHLGRRAVVYLRQSTMKQVHDNRESTQRQYALGQRATELGWPSAMVDVIDEDLGQSGTSTQGRPGFKRLAEDVSHGRVGVIFALEVSRLARSSADWHHLLDLCGWSDVLIADEAAVFTPNDPNDRLLLGLKGQMSEAERYWMRLRLHGALQSKARRGELRLQAPTGYVWDAATQQLCFDPDEEVQQGVRLLFERFRIDGSAGAVMAYFIEHGLTLPVRRPNGDLVRRRLYRSGLLDILHSPIYAGAYVHGRREYRTRLIDGKVRRGQMTRLPMESWKVCLRDHHAAYIGWEEFVRNQAKLESNRNRRCEDGAARKGSALLQGLVLCGRCGYRMTVQQGGTSVARYVCTAPQQHGVSTKVCWSVTSRAIDAVVSDIFLAAAQPSEVELSLAVAREVERQAGELDRQWKARLDRAHYEARLAERRYKAVDPDNRVVARSLECDWEAKLREMQQLEEDYQRSRRIEKVDLTDVEYAQVMSLARDLPRVWSSPTTTQVQRKNLLRVLIQQVTLTPVDVPRRMTRLQILWHSGAVTEATAERPRRIGGTAAPATVVEEIRKRTAEEWSDGAIAEELNRREVATSKGLVWNSESVRAVRQRRKIRSTRAPPKGPLWPTKRPDGLVSLRGVAERFEVSKRQVRSWRDSGLIHPAAGGGRGQPLWFDVNAEMVRVLEEESKKTRGRPRASAGGEE
jgi:DNA invertase Pin-like site-specific DNA recombinase